MFDKYKILEYVLKNVFNGHRKSYFEVYRYFDVKFEEYKEDISYEVRKTARNFHDALEKVDNRIVRDILFQDEVPIYTIFIYSKRDELPSTGFYELFYNKNRETFKDIAGNLKPIEVFNYHPIIKQKIYEKGLEILENDLIERFPDEESIDSFIDEVRMLDELPEFDI